MTSPALRRVKALAMALLLLALVCVGLALWSGKRQTLVQGPWGLAVLPGGQVWLAVDEQLWRLDAEGRRLQVVDRAQAGLPGAVGILMPHPAGHLAAFSRHSPALHLLGADDARPVQRLTPQWPADLVRHGDIAIHFAFAPDGRVAIASGGGHAVALFDDQGRYLARSAPDTFRFTNGLWWADGGWWSTDTNRPALVRLEDASLAETQRIALAEPQQEGRFLALAAASRGMARDGKAPLGTVTRLANDMEHGHVVDVWPDGAQQPFPLPEGSGVFVPRALAWLGDRLLVVDGQGFALRQYSADRQRLADWGDATVRTELSQRHAEVLRWRSLYQWCLAGAVGLFLLGLGVAIRAQRLEARARLARHAPDLVKQADWQPGIDGVPRLSFGQLLWQALRVTWPVSLVIVASVVLSRGLGQLAGQEPLDATLVRLVMAAVLLLLALAWRHMLHVVQTDPALEPLANLRAQRMLARPDLFWPLRQRGERPRETLMLGTRWLVLTNQRVLLFRVNAFDARLQTALPRGAIRAAQCMPLKQAPRWYWRWMGRLTPGFGFLSLSLADGKLMAGVASSAQVARRLAALIGGAPAAPVAVPQKALSPEERRRAKRQVLASLLMPGAGQWMQRRSGMALLLFVAWLWLMVPFAYAAWVAWTPSKEVAPGLLWQLGLLALVPSLAAAADAWRMRGSVVEAAS
ncbi:MAG: hypothetical protein Q4G71_02850 [Pseudomonadota bacterium]|nr:hypothetical protein [Pseudomonadota bacterium]